MSSKHAASALHWNINVRLVALWCKVSEKEFRTLQSSTQIYSIQRHPYSPFKNVGEVPLKKTLPCESKHIVVHKMCSTFVDPNLTRPRYLDIVFEATLLGKVSLFQTTSRLCLRAKQSLTFFQKLVAWWVVMCSQLLVLLLILLPRKIANCHQNTLCPSLKCSPFVITMLFMKPLSVHISIAP